MTREKAWVYSTRVPDHAFLAWRVVVYYTTAAGNSISSELGSSYQGKEKSGGTARPSQTKSRVTLPPASQAGRRAVPVL